MTDQKVNSQDSDDESKESWLEPGNGQHRSFVLYLIVWWLFHVVPFWISVFFGCPNHTSLIELGSIFMDCLA